MRQVRSINENATAKKDEGGIPSKMEVQLGKRTGGKVGAPLGNRNRLRHGRYTQERVIRRARTRALLRKTRVLICRLDLMANARRAFATKNAANANSTIKSLGFERQVPRNTRLNSFFQHIPRCHSRRAMRATHALRGKGTQGTGHRDCCPGFPSLTSTLSRRCSPGMTMRLSIDHSRNVRAPPNAFDSPPHPPGFTLMNGVALPGIMVWGRWPSHFSAVTSAGRPGLSRSASPRARIAEASASPCAFNE
jgi:hypothetical protein